MSIPFNRIDASYLPQDPFLPQYPVQGPSFLDSEACLCALRSPPPSSTNSNTDTNTQSAWQCIGNQTQGVYAVNSGKWFLPRDTTSTTIDGPVWDASNPPATSRALTYTSGALRDANLDSLSIFDRFCTAQNRSSFSTSFYQAADRLSRDELPIEQLPCYRPGAFPMQMQTVASWADKGCNEGFLCTNNTVNSSPQFCPPITECQMARLAGMVCSFRGANIGMGPFEPVVCLQGNYCPPPGKESIKCPAGHYCQPGCSTPTPCAFGSTCPAGSQFEIYWVPLGLLVLADVLLIVGILLLVFRRRLKSSQRSHVVEGKVSESIPTRMGTIKNALNGYGRLRGADHDVDHEMAPLHATYMPSRDAWTGFQEALNLSELPGSGVDIEAKFSPQLRAFVDSMKRATDATRLGLSFSYTDLSFRPKRGGPFILNKVTGAIDRGALTAVMGGSGAGKSTFVNVLMGKITNTSGAVSINNVPGKIKRYKKLIGYVPQDDIVLPELTVFENILHSARIRLPHTWADEDIKAHVQSVVDCLELSHVRDSLVGSVGKPVISGGQRKRVSIGMELAAAPMAIFLDEPTSGLDATAASSIMRTLKALAALGMTVIVVIHQPRREIFEMIDSLILLGKGQTIYEGSGRDVKGYFAQMGYQAPQEANFGDIVTDIITGNGRNYKRAGDVSREGLIGHWERSRQSAVLREKRASVMSLPSSDIQSNRKSIQQVLRRRGAAPWKQFWLCLKRYFLQQFRTKTTLLFELGLSLLAGFLLGLAMNSKKGVMFIGLYHSPYEVLSIAMDFKSVPELSLLIAIAIGLISGAPGVKVFSEELLLHRRESEAGHSRLSYFLAKTIGVFPRMALACIHFTVPLFLLATPTINWATAFLANLLYFYCIYGLASLISMLIRREDAPLIATMVTLIVGILSGNAPPLSAVKQWHMEWLWRSSPGVWLAEIYFGQLISPFGYLYKIDIAAQATGFHLDRLWRNMLILGGIGTAYRILAFAGLFAGKRLRV
ncbi:ATP-binding cassette subfamily G (WHITE) member 2 [Microdochium nivale]|nr:ATP-binding cassette subfamily G (WHITE) member 2 [Microdochium nivale]